MTEKLILTVGLPYSGKSTWARATDLPIVNPDAIRMALHGQRFVASAEPMVWAVAHLMVDALFRAGHDTVILDACSVTEKRRAEWRPDAELRVFKTTPAECLRRAREAGDEHIIPTIERMAAAWDLPRPELWD